MWELVHTTVGKDMKHLTLENVKSLKDRVAHTFQLFPKLRHWWTFYFLFLFNPHSVVCFFCFSILLFVLMLSRLCNDYKLFWTVFWYLYTIVFKKNVALHTRSNANTKQNLKNPDLITRKCSKSMSVQHLVSQEFFSKISLLFFFWMQLLSRRIKSSCYHKMLISKDMSRHSADLCKRDWFENCHVNRIIFFLQHSFLFKMKHAMWWKWLIHCYFCPREQNVLQGKKKIKINVGLYPHLVGNGLSLFRSSAVSGAVKAKDWLTNVKLCVVLWTFNQFSFALSEWCKNY